tara:strand:- start:272 stop:382 length:111 start_codon:yes stop_codon:yes gene_type:complete
MHAHIMTQKEHLLSEENSLYYEILIKISTLLALEML